MATASSSTSRQRSPRTVSGTAKTTRKTSASGTAHDTQKATGLTGSSNPENALLAVVEELDGPHLLADLNGGLLQLIVGVQVIDNQLMIAAFRGAKLGELYTPQEFMAQPAGVQVRQIESGLSVEARELLLGLENNQEYALKSVVRAALIKNAS